MSGQAAIGVDCNSTACIRYFSCSAPSLLSLAALQVAFLNLPTGTILNTTMTIKSSAMKSRLSFRTHRKYFSLVSIGHGDDAALNAVTYKQLRPNTFLIISMHTIRAPRRLLVPSNLALLKTWA
jgi:hypothetical protein